MAQKLQQGGGRFKMGVGGDTRLNGYTWTACRIHLFFISNKLNLYILLSIYFI